MEEAGLASWSMFSLFLRSLKMTMLDGYPVSSRQRNSFLWRSLLQRRNSRRRSVHKQPMLAPSPSPSPSPSPFPSPPPAHETNSTQIIVLQLLSFSTSQSFYCVPSLNCFLFCPLSFCLILKLLNILFFKVSYIASMEKDLASTRHGSVALKEQLAATSEVWAEPSAAARLLCFCCCFVVVSAGWLQIVKWMDGW